MSGQGELAQEIQALGPWFHNLHLPGGVQTQPRHFLGGDFPHFKWEQLAPSVPQDLRGWRVLDVGCNAGFYSFELAQRGAQVVAIDTDEHYLAQARWAARRIGGPAVGIEFRRMQVYDFLHGSEKFDLVWFMGVFYHLRYPLLALDLLARMTGRMMVFQTLTVPDDAPDPQPEDCGIDERNRLRQPGWPMMAFIEHRLAGDPTNWWAANPTGVEAMLRSAGLRVCGRPGHEMYVCEPAPASADHRALYADQYAAVAGTR